MDLQAEAIDRLTNLIEISLQFILCSVQLCQVGLAMQSSTGGHAFSSGRSAFLQKTQGDPKPGAAKRSQPTTPTSDRQKLLRRMTPQKNENGFVLGNGQNGWTDVFAAPGIGSARVCQALIGEAVGVINQRGGWSEIKPVSGSFWRGWVRSDQVTLGGPEFQKALRLSSRVIIVKSPWVIKEKRPTLPFGAMLPGTRIKQSFLVLLPNDLKIHLAPGDARITGSVSLKEAATLGRGFVGVPYGLGGNTGEAMDSEGLMSLVLGVAGISVSRNLQSLRSGGMAIGQENLAAGDIVFAAAYDSRKPRPILVLDTRNVFIDASPTWGVYIGRLDELEHQKVIEARRYKVPERSDPTRQSSPKGAMPAVAVALPDLSMTMPEDPRIEGKAVFPDIPQRGEIGFVIGSREKGGWADVYQLPDILSEKICQALVGDPVSVRRIESGWAEIESRNSDAWSGWTRFENLARADNQFRKHASDSKWVVVEAPGIKISESLFLPYGALLPKIKGSKDPLGILPDGRRIRFKPAEVRDFGSVTLREALEKAVGFSHVRYQRGANTVDAMDAPGLIFLLHRVAGINISRNIKGLLQTGKSVPITQMKTGDVIFYSTFDPRQPHPVILRDDGLTFLEASPAGGVNLGSTEQMRNREIVSIRRYSTGSGS